MPWIAMKAKEFRYAVDLDEAAACDVVRMLRRLGQVEDRREADIAAFHQRAPFIAGLAAEYRSEARA